MSDNLNQQLAQFMAAKSCYTGAIAPGTLPNSMMPVQVASRFIDETVDQSVLLRRARVLQVDHCQGKIPKLDLTGPVTHGASALSCPTSPLPTEKSMFYELVKYRSYFEIETDFLECNLERGAAQNTILGMFKKAIANDSEIAAIHSDSSLTVGDTASSLNNLLGVNDGWLKQICSCVPECNILDAAGAAPSQALYFQAKTRIPTRFRGISNQFRFIVGPQVYDHWAFYWGNRITDGGDRVLQTGDAPGPWGTPFLPVPLWPEMIPYGSSGTPVTHILLTPPENLVYIVGRQLRMERERVPKCDLDYWVMHWTADFLIEDPNKVVLIKNVDVCGTAYDGCERCGPVDDIDNCPA